MVGSTRVDESHAEVLLTAFVWYSTKRPDGPGSHENGRRLQDFRNGHAGSRPMVLAKRKYRKCGEGRMAVVSGTSGSATSGRHLSWKEQSDGDFADGGQNPYPSDASLSAVKSASYNLSLNFSNVLPEKYSIQVGMPLVVEPIIPKPDGTYVTKSNPDACVEKTFMPFFEQRLKVGKEPWTKEHVF